MNRRENPTNGAPAQVNMIGQGTVIDGSVTAKSDLRISGKVTGKVTVEGKAIVSSEGEIEGEIHASDAEIAGTVQGNVFVKERLVLKETAVFEGDVKTNKLVVEDGAKFSGKCGMGNLFKSQQPMTPPKKELPVPPPQGEKSRV